MPNPTPEARLCPTCGRRPSERHATAIQSAIGGCVYPALCPDPIHDAADLYGPLGEEMERLLRELLLAESEGWHYDAAGRRLCRLCGDFYDHQKYGTLCQVAQTRVLLRRLDAAKEARRG